jgi:hypothetical protein
MKFELEAEWGNALPIIFLPLDYLYIYDGNDTSVAPLYTLSGYTIPKRIVTPGASVTIQFVSDQLVTFSGFKLKYQLGN